MKKYFSCYNNGVTAIVSEEAYNDFGKLARIYHYFCSQDTDPKCELRKTAYEAVMHLANHPTFTFARSERVSESPWFTGDNELAGALMIHIRTSGGSVDQRGFQVPFSNAVELGIHGQDSMKKELAYVTTEEQFRETFGITRAELLAKSNL